MELGRLDVCIRVGDVATSRTFYEGLGFDREEGDDGEGWAVMVNGTALIGLFAHRYMGDDAFSFNFRGASIPKIAEELKAKGYETQGPPKFKGEHGGSIRLRDPDGHLIFFDTESA